jgi:nucleoside-diphosphate-sugar epimerase
MQPIARIYAPFNIPRFVIVLVLLWLWQEPVAEKSASHQRVVTTGMVIIDAGHKKQFGPNRAACLVIGGSARLAKMLRVFGAATNGVDGPRPRGMIWQKRTVSDAPAGHENVLIADPLQAGAVTSALKASGFDGIDTILCFAGVIRGDAAALALNSDLAISCLEIARDIGARRVVLASSAAVYGAQPGQLDEGCALIPSAPYGVAKVEMERAAQAWRVEHAPEIEVCALRIGNVAGADALLGGAHLGEITLDIFGDTPADGQGPRRSYIGPREFARAIGRVLAADQLPAALNLALPGTVTMDGLLRAASREFVPRLAGAGAIASVELGCDLAVRLGIVPPDIARESEIIADLRSYEALI